MKLPATILAGILLWTAAGLANCARSQSASPSVLIFTKTEGFRHSSIPRGVAALQSLANDRPFRTHHTEDADNFHPDSLENFDGVIFLNTTGNILDAQQQQALMKFIQQGGGFMGIHAAADTEYNWAWYGRMIGAYFDGHPPVQEATLQVRDKSHPATSFLPSRWVRTDEWYNFKNIRPGIRVLITIDESTYRGGTNGQNHPVAWYREFEGGRMFYTALGHTADSYADSLFRKHLWGGLKYILDSSPDTTD